MAYGKDNYSKQANTTKKQEQKPKKEFSIKGKAVGNKEQKKKTCYTCSGEGHMSRNCPSKNNKAKRKPPAKKEATSNLAEQHNKYEEVYINTLKFESYATAKTKTAHPATIKVHHTLKGTMFINGKVARVLFDTGTIGANLISAAFVTTHGIPCTTMKEPTKILMAMKGSRSESQKEYLVNIAVDKLQTKGNKMLVGNLAKYDALIGMPFLNSVVHEPARAESRPGLEPARLVAPLDSRTRARVAPRLEDSSPSRTKTRGLEPGSSLLASLLESLGSSNRDSVVYEPARATIMPKARVVIIPLHTTLII